MTDHQMMRQTEDGDWMPAKPLPFYYGLLPRIARWFTCGRWPQ